MAAFIYCDEGRHIIQQLWTVVIDYNSKRQRNQMPKVSNETQTLEV